MVVLISEALKNECTKNWPKGEMVKGLLQSEARQKSPLVRT